MTITSKNSGADDKFEVYQIRVADVATDTEVADVVGDIANTEGADAFYTLDTAALASYDGASTTNADNYIFEINGSKFAFVTGDDAAKALDSDVNYVKTASTAADDTETLAMIALINEKTGIGAVVNGSANTSIDLMAGKTDASKGNGLSLQIGDTADKFNQIKVNVGDMSSKSLGISGVDISSQSGAESAIEKIKTAINSVSGTRGKLGAIQNRLEHTINNLSVATENITEAESRIRT